jgi:hypothetical protein
MRGRDQVEAVGAGGHRQQQHLHIVAVLKNNVCKNLRVF